MVEVGSSLVGSGSEYSVEGRWVIDRDRVSVRDRTPTFSPEGVVDGPYDFVGTVPRDT